jgi:hypothetical protein
MLALIIVHLASTGWQTAVQLDSKTALKIVLVNGLLIAMSVQLIVRHGYRQLPEVLATLAFAFVWFGVLNLLADATGYAADFNSERTATLSSRYLTGEYRWQAPLYSSGRLSGLLRWAIPILAVMLLRYRMYISRFVASVAIVCAAYVLWKCEFRAAIFPTAIALIWMVVGNRRLQAALACACVVYAIVAPILWTSDTFPTILARTVPDQVLQLAGNQDAQQVLTLTGRTDLWAAAIEVLESGKYFWAGQGPVRFDAINDLGFFFWTDIETDPTYRVGYHHGVLDVVFTYGVVPSAIVIGLLLILIFRATAATSWIKAGVDSELASLALFAIAMVAVSNWHDGFFASNDFFYIIVAVSACVLSALLKNAARANYARTGARRTAI